uniref:Uncharacterized protein n=1 Tax=Candidatus Hodgkinia cicadicola TaxID=573658 RepID=A0A097GZT1_9HYPH|nr:hypothetical protein HCTETAUR1_008 [Candidatus Hodgkinia cicadicola]
MRVWGGSPPSLCPHTTKRRATALRNTPERMITLPIASVTPQVFGTPHRYLRSKLTQPKRKSVLNSGALKSSPQLLWPRHCAHTNPTTQPNKPPATPVFARSRAQQTNRQLLTRAAKNRNKPPRNKISLCALRTNTCLLTHSR